LRLSLSSSHPHTYCDSCNHVFAFTSDSIPFSVKEEKKEAIAISLWSILFVKEGEDPEKERALYWVHQRVTLKVI